jgi:hypothetical protein
MVLGAAQSHGHTGRTVGDPFLLETRSRQRTGGARRRDSPTQGDQGGPPDHWATRFRKDAASADLGQRRRRPVSRGWRHWHRGADSRTAETICSRGRVPCARVKRLLGNGREQVSTAAAIGVWLAEPKGSVPEDLKSEWIGAILNANADDDESYMLGEVLAREPSLALAWLRRRAANEGIRYRFFLPDAYKKAVGALDAESREQLFRELGTDFGTQWRSRLAGPDDGS